MALAVLAWLVMSSQGTTVNGFDRFIRDRCLNRVSGNLWISHEVFDWDDKEPRDYYRAYFEDAEGNPLSRLVQVHPDRLDVKLWDAEEKTFDQADVVERYLDRPLRIRRILKGEVQIRYDSEREFLLRDWWWPRTAQLRERLFQTAYERRTGIKTDRLKVLEAILNARLQDNDFNYVLGDDVINSEQLVVKMFGRRALNRKHDGGRLFSRIDLILESLLESGDLEAVGEGGPGQRSVRPRGKAMATLSQASTEERRHRDTKLLTKALVMVGVLQVVAAAMQIQPVRDWVGGIAASAESWDTTITRSTRTQTPSPAFRQRGPQ
jgi:hypothetical protein